MSDMPSLAVRVRDYLKVKFENYTKPKDEFQLIIIDDLFPYLITIYRQVEFNYYLKHLPGTIVYSTTDSFEYAKVKGTFEEVLSEYEQVHPENKGRVIRFDYRRRLRGKLVYVVFLHIAYHLVPILEEQQIPFVFTLYPGGTFQLHDERSDAHLRRVCSSPMFRKVITNQKVIKDYLVDNNFCSADKIEFIFGTLMDAERLTQSPVKRPLYGQDKNTFDICFVGFKYMPRGSDKGYDTFIDTARLLCARHPHVRFHVVGDFVKEDIDISDIEDRFTFYGPQRTDFFLEFHARMDIVLSPNIPFVLGKGAFDGFPIGAWAEAGLSGVAVFCTDYLQQNQAFEPGREIEIIDNNAVHIADNVSSYYENYDRLIALGRNGRSKFAEVFSVETQMTPRLELMKRLLKQESSR